MTRPSKPFSRTAKIKLGSARFPQPAARRDETGGRCGACVRASGGGGGGVRTREPLVLTSLPSGTTLHLIRWCLSPQTSNVGLNFSSHSTPMCAAIKMGFEIFLKLLIGLPQMGPNFNNPPPDLKFPFRDFAKPRFLFIYQCFSRDC